MGSSLMSISNNDDDDETFDRPLSVVDRLCTLTNQTSELRARHLRGIIATLSFVCVLLFVCFGMAIWRADVIEQEREVLAQELHAERSARIKATLAARDVEMNLATNVLDTQVRRDIVDERMQQQEQRSAELEQLALQVEREKLIKADCVTPKSIFAVAGL